MSRLRPDMDIKEFAIYVAKILKEKKIDAILMEDIL